MDTLSTGSSGTQVGILQQCLGMLGYNIGKVDRSFGNGTQAAIIQFQTDKGLTADGVVGPASWAAIQAAVPNPFGLDISHFNTIDLNALPDMIKFIYCKATDGVTFKDPNFKSYISTLQANNTIRGAYHFFRFMDPVQDQVDNYLAQIAGLSGAGTLPPALDIEDQVDPTANAYVINNKATCIAAMQQWLDAVAQQTGQTPVIYSYRSFWHDNLGNPSGFSSYPLWLASYQTAQPGIPGDWSDKTIWQFFGADESSAGEADMDVFNGTMSDLNTLAGVATA